MKKLLKLLIVGVGLGALILTVMATDTSKRPGWYDDRGITVGAMMLEFIDSTDYDDSLIFYGITGLVATPTGNAVATQLQRRVKTIPIVMATAGEDTTWFPLLTVSAGQTVTITEILFSAHTEAAGNNDSCWASILYYQGTAKGTLDTCVAIFPTDAESLAYDDTVYTLTMIDSVFTAGDIITFWNITLEGAATGGEGAAITLEYLLDE